MGGPERGIAIYRLVALNALPQHSRDGFLQNQADRSPCRENTATRLRWKTRIFKRLAKTESSAIHLVEIRQNLLGLNKLREIDQQDTRQKGQRNRKSFTICFSSAQLNNRHSPKNLSNRQNRKSYHIFPRRLCGYLPPDPLNRVERP